jgi:hypothetical protein
LYGARTTVLFVAGFLLLGAGTLIVDLRAKRAAKTSESYLSPLNGITERVPAPFRVRQFSLWALSAGVLAIGYTTRGEYLFSSVWYLHVVIALYSAWVYRRGSEPKLMGASGNFRIHPAS